MAVASESIAMQPDLARQNGRGVWLYNPPPATASQISSKEATKHAAYSMARNAALVPISQGTEVTKVTECVPFRYFTRTASKYRRKYGNQFNHAVPLFCVLSPDKKVGCHHAESLQDEATLVIYV